MEVLTVQPESAVRGVSLWRPGQRPKKGDLGQPAESGTVRWFDVCGGPEATGAVFEALSAHCLGLSREMVQGLLTPDEEPTGTDYAEGAIRLASTFSVEARRDEVKGDRGTPRPAGVLVFQPVELLAADDWLITCWHPRQIVRGAERLEEGCGRSEVVYQEVAQVWAGGKGEKAGDLGLLIMHELSLTYAPAHRAIYTWLEDWELGFYTGDERFDRDGLAELWGARATLRDWLSPLNRPGLRDDLSKAWLPASSLPLVIDVDERIDKALSNLARLGEALRSAFSIIHLQQGEETKRRAESMQRRIEVLGVLFLVPTLIVGFYGANTWVPGQGRHWGFWVMVAALLVLSLVAVSLVRQWHKAQKVEDQRRAAEQARLRAEVLRGI